MEIALNRAIPKEATVNRSAPGVLKAVKCLDHQKWFFCFQKIRHSKVQIVDIILIQPLHGSASALLIFRIFQDIW